MPDIALYYPYTHIRDQAWLKAAALYLPKLALIAPPGYPLRLSREAEVLRDELGFMVNVDPERRTRAVAAEFLELISRDGDALTARFAWPAEFPADLYEIVGIHGDGCWAPGRRHRDDAARVEWIHLGKVGPELTDTLVSLRLGVPNPDRTWLALHSQLGAVYLSALADQIAQANDIPVITDQPQAYGALNGWDTGTLARILLSDDDSTPAAGRPTEEISTLYAALAIQAVVPQGLANIPVEKIVQARRAWPRNSTRSRPISTRWRTSSPRSLTSRTRRSCTPGSRSCSTGTCASPWHSWNAACARSASNPAGPSWA